MKSKVEAIEDDDPKGVIWGCLIAILAVLFVIFVLPWLLLAFGWIMNRIGEYWLWVSRFGCGSDWQCMFGGGY